MRLAGLIAGVLLLATSSSWAGADIKELTKDNLDSPWFEFKLAKADYWFIDVFKVSVRPKKEPLSAVCDQVRACLGHCQKSANEFSLQERGSTASEKNGALIYTFHVPKGTHKCLYLWWNCGGTMPCEDIWWVNLDSPVWRGNETPK